MGRIKMYTNDYMTRGKVVSAIIKYIQCSNTVEEKYKFLL